MNAAFIIGTLQAIILLLVGMVAWADKGGSSHLADSDCQECHLSAKASDLKKARMLVGSQEKLCVRCHAKAVQLSHPSGFAPGRLLPPIFPLDWKGDLTCSSCHQIHGTSAKLMRGSAKGFALCRDCHNDEFFAKMSSRGGSMARHIHMDSNASPSTSATTLDDSSRKCLECHDDKGGSANNRVGLDSKGVLRHMRSSLSHPLGTPYRALPPLSTGYRPASSLPAAIVLPDGKVGCLTCHEGTGSGTQHGGLTISNLGSALCTACHVR
ncbi:MAG: cytochrome c3 family protein [Magnetococcus sp. YQC-3]